MATTAIQRIEASARVASSTQELFDDGIEQLLSEAERKLSPGYAVNSSFTGGGAMAAPSSNDTGIFRMKIPSLQHGKLPHPYVRLTGNIARAEPSSLVGAEDRRMANGPRRVEDPFQAKQRQKKKKRASAGPDWFNMPRTDLTPELKRDLQLLQMRSVLDPKRHYKKDNSSKKFVAPDFAQTGTVVQGSTEYFSGRIPKKERKGTFVQEVLGKAQDMDRFKRKYSELQTSKSSGKKAYYKQLKAKRSKGKPYG